MPSKKKTFKTSEKIKNSPSIRSGNTNSTKEKKEKNYIVYIIGFALFLMSLKLVSICSSDNSENKYYQKIFRPLVKRERVLDVNTKLNSVKDSTLNSEDVTINTENINQTYIPTLVNKQIPISDKKEENLEIHTNNSISQEDNWTKYNLGDSVESGINKMLVDSLTGEIKEYKKINDSLVISKLDQLGDEIKKTRSCNFGFFIINRTQKRIRDGLDIRLEISMLRRINPSITTIFSNVDSSSIPSRSSIIKSISSQHNLDNNHNVLSINNVRTESTENVKSEKEHCKKGFFCRFIEGLKVNFGIRKISPISVKDDTIKDLSYNISYKDLLLLLRDSGKVRSSNIISDINRVIDILVKLDKAEELLLEYCIL